MEKKHRHRYTLVRVIDSFMLKDKAPAYCKCGKKKP